MELFKVYIIKSIGADRYYVGSTSDLEKRLNSHNSSRAKWTKRYQPWEVVYTESYSTRGEAVKREKFLKSFKNIKKFLDVDEAWSHPVTAGLVVGSSPVSRSKKKKNLTFNIKNIS